MMMNDSSATESTSFETLNEPVIDTIMRDLRMVGAKLKQVVKLTNSSDDQANITLSLHNWDLWSVK
jgi:hypothetical protein